MLSKTNPFAAVFAASFYFFVAMAAQTGAQTPPAAPGAPAVPVRPVAALLLPDSVAAVLAPSGARVDSMVMFHSPLEDVVGAVIADWQTRPSVFALGAGVFWQSPFGGWPAPV